MNVLLLSLATIVGSTEATSFTEKACLERGFDPPNLSCETCRLLEESATLQSLQSKHNSHNQYDPIDIVAECHSCCQSHKFNPTLHPGSSLRGKYRFALLTYNKNTIDQYGEIKDFIERDLDDVLSFKGDKRFQAMASEKSTLDADTMRMLMMMGGGLQGLGGPPKLMLFDNQTKGKGEAWSEEDESEAVEVIKLKGWKREDLKDMLLTLLPNA